MGAFLSGGKGVVFRGEEGEVPGKREEEEGICREVGKAREARRALRRSRSRRPEAAEPARRAGCPAGRILDSAQAGGGGGPGRNDSRMRKLFVV